MTYLFCLERKSTMIRLKPSLKGSLRISTRTEQRNRSERNGKSDPEPRTLRRCWSQQRNILHPSSTGFLRNAPEGWRPLAPALIYQLRSMVTPPQTTVNGPNPDDWCRSLNRSPRFAVLIDGKLAPVDSVWIHSLRPVTAEEYLQHWTLRRWAGPIVPCGKRAPERRSQARPR